MVLKKTFELLVNDTIRYDDYSRNKNYYDIDYMIKEIEENINYNLEEVEEEVE